MTDSNTIAPSGATSPRQHVAAMVDDLVEKGRSGEHILQLIERQTVGFSTKCRRLAFFRVKVLSDKCREAA